MNAFNTVNLAGACLLTNVEYAKELGIPEDRWIYPLGGAGTQDSGDCKSLLEIRNIKQLKCINTLIGKSGNDQTFTQVRAFLSHWMLH
jgi:hypothetical protein